MPRTPSLATRKRAVAAYLKERLTKTSPRSALDRYALENLNYNLSKVKTNADMDNLVEACAEGARYDVESVVEDIIRDIEDDE